MDRVVIRPAMFAIAVMRFSLLGHSASYTMLGYQGENCMTAGNAAVLTEIAALVTCIRKA
ncbi:hypothetical protein [Dyella monticola]|uniref:hypothetical protein n=1 Tax=Dyella monticola TaxID=1927958 RepID=UPI0011C05640|nr:hypothetical protein [Dyella monticola]